MTQTVHGHHIPRTGRNDEKKDITPRPCGGVVACGSCKMEMRSVLMAKYPEDFQKEI